MRASETCILSGFEAILCEYRITLLLVRETRFEKLQVRVFQLQLRCWDWPTCVNEIRKHQS